MKPEPKSKSKIADYLAVVIIILIVVGVAFGPTTPPSPYSPAIKASAMQNAHLIGIFLYRYSQDHNGHYPEGKTSTEVFQKLIDEKYVDDPSIFSVWKLSKSRPRSNHLESENVGWDVTYGIDSSAPEGLPVVFFTGYKITYEAGAPAVPIDQSPRTWAQWWNGPDVMKRFAAVCYKDGSSQAIKAKEDGSIPNFIPADFDPKGKVYRQLTP